MRKQFLVHVVEADLVSETDNCNITAILGSVQYCSTMCSIYIYVADAQMKQSSKTETSF